MSTDDCLSETTRKNFGLRTCPCHCSFSEQEKCVLAPVSAAANIANFLYVNILILFFVFVAVFEPLRMSGNAFVYHALSIAVPFLVQHAHFNLSNAVTKTAMLITIVAVITKAIFVGIELYAVLVNPGSCEAYAGCDGFVLAFAKLIACSVFLIILDIVLLRLLNKHVFLLRRWYRKNKL